MFFGKLGNVYPSRSHNFIYWIIPVIIIFEIWFLSSFSYIAPLLFVSIQLTTSSVSPEDPSNSHGEINPSLSESIDENQADEAFATRNCLELEICPF